MRILVLQTQMDAPPGNLAEWADARGATLAVVMVSDPAQLPDPADYDFAIALGSEASLAVDPPAWVHREVQWLRRADAEGVPVLGICFGAQALAVAHGGHVTQLPAPEIGWITIETDDDSYAGPGPWMAWHDDVITLPPDGREVARNATGPQVFTCGRHLGVQFHPEASAPVISGWAAGSAGGALTDTISVDALVQATHENAAKATTAAHALFDGFVARANAHA